jgi:hypothetical protein
MPGLISSGGKTRQNLYQRKLNKSLKIIYENSFIFNISNDPGWNKDRRFVL